ncbi:MAG: HAMP domain-containing sensor histidine kinase [Myxococcales bacterium]|nr:HAMP domain-containing sensor histidine kinase [Myxococcales bacterium]
MRYQHWPYAAIRDAAGLVQLLWAARALTEQDIRVGEADIAAMLGIAPERLKVLQTEAIGRAETVLQRHLGRIRERLPERIDQALVRHLLLEDYSARLTPQTDITGAVLALGAHLHEVHGLSHPIYLAYVAPEDRLYARPLQTHAPPPLLSIPVKESGNAAARACRQRWPQITLPAQEPDASLLDAQLTRLAGRDGVLAIPIGSADPAGVLLMCGHGRQLAELRKEENYLSRLGRLAAMAAPATSSASAPAPATILSARLSCQARFRQLAHEINNPLGIISNYLGLMRVRLGQDPAMDDELRVIQEELGRIARIVQSLLIERIDTGELSEVIDLNATLADLAKVAGAGTAAHKGVRIELRLDEDLPRPRLQADKLRQLLLNLLLNAMEAAPEHSTVTVETSRVIDHLQQRRIEVLISNTGPQIAPELWSHLFEPVKSAKGGDHAGLGLAIVRDLAAQLDLAVACRSHSDQTTFQILIPVGEAAERPPAPS